MNHGARLPDGVLEHSILHLLWKVGSASSEEIYDRLSALMGLEEAATLRALDRLCAKELVARRLSGRGLIYRPLVTSEDIDQGRARELLERLLSPDPESAIASLEAIEPNVFRELAKVVEARAKSRSRT